jgi:hypothetical protein
VGTGVHVFVGRGKVGLPAVAVGDGVRAGSLRQPKAAPRTSTINSRPIRFILDSPISLDDGRGIARAQHYVSRPPF